MKISEHYKKTLGLSDNDKLSDQIRITLNWIWKYLRPYKKGLVICFVISILLTLISLASSVLSKYVIDSVIYKQKNIFIFSVILSVVLYLISTFAGIYTNRKNFEITTSSTNDIRTDVFKKVFNVSWENTLLFRPGDLINRVKGETATLSDGFITNIFSLLKNSIILIGSIGIIIYYDYIFAVIALVGAPILTITYRLLMKKMRDLSRKTKISESEVMSYTSESIYNLQAIKSFSISALKIFQLINVLNKNKKIKTEQNDYSIFVNTLIGFLGVLASYSCLAWAIYRLWLGEISYGTMTMFVRLSGYMMSSVGALIGFFPALINTVTSVTRIREVTDLEPEDPETEAKANEVMNTVKGNIEGIHFDNIDISYRTKKDILKKVDINISKGNTVALVGLSGGGKTTIFRVLLGLIKAENGKAYINTPLPNYEQITISPYTRKLFSYVPQGNIIFSGSIADNIRIVNQNLTDEQIIKYLKLACAYDFVEPMPDGINSIIGENGFGLSEGQSQRIAIARAIACDAPIMLFDEATSALDAHTEKVVLNNISSLDGNHICIFSTHRFSVLDICDKIYHVANNSVTELTQKQAHDYCLDI
jgi:ABC-type bacteriocin/lantibiotic exporter with double-glycine peptidase domain